MTRVWLRDLPHLLHDMLSRGLAGDEGVRLLKPELGLAYPVFDPDIVIGGDDPGNPQWAQEVLKRWPESRVLIVESGGHTASLFEMRPHRTPLGEMSFDELVRVVTSVAREPHRGAIARPAQTGPMGALSAYQVESTHSNRSNPMNEQSGGYDSNQKPERDGITQLVAAVLAIHADLQARPGAPSPEVKKAIEAANLLVELLKNDVSLPEAPKRTPTADVDEILRSLSSLRGTQA